MTASPAAPSPGLPRPGFRRPDLRRGFRPGPALAGFGLATALGVVLGLIGPFGSYLNDGPVGRIAYWTVSLWSGWLVFGPTLSALDRLAGRRAWPLWAWSPPAVVLLSLAPTVTSRLIATTIWPVTRQVGWLEWWGQCLVVSVVAAGLALWSGRTFRDRSAPVAADRPAPRTPLPGAPSRDVLGRDVLCLQMEDHYVRVHTPSGSTLVLMSMAQAVAALRGVEGRRTHRSWWVARRAVAGVVSDGRNLRLRLIGGLEAPVARSQVGALRAAGWLSDADAADA